MKRHKASLDVRSKRGLPLGIAVVGAVALSLGLSACAGDDKITREDAAPCITVLQPYRVAAAEVAKAEAAWDRASNAFLDPTRRPASDEQIAQLRADADSYARARDDYLADIRAACTPETLSFARQIDPTPGGNLEIRYVCADDPFRESRLCADLPQPGAQSP